jgi:hypothetical protein
MNWRDGVKSPVWSGCLASPTMGKSSVLGLGEGWSWFTTGLRKRYVFITILKEWNILTVKQNSFKELSNTSVLPFNEPVESMDYDGNNSRLALSSHTGKIKIFHLEKNGMNYLPWVVDIVDKDFQEHWYLYGARIGMIPRKVKAWFHGVFSLQARAKTSWYLG